MSDTPHQGHRERLRVKYAEQGANAFLDHEYLELLLTYAIPRRDTNALSHALMDRFGSLEAILMADTAQLTRVQGVGQSAAVFLRMIGDAKQRLDLGQLAGPRGCIALKTPLDTARYAEAQLYARTCEYLMLVSLNAKKAVVACDTLQGGAPAEALVSPRAIVETAILRHAHSVLLMHNHPSGDPSPSADDRRATESLKAALESVSIPLADHLIVGGRHVYSFAANAIIDASTADSEVCSLDEYHERASVRRDGLLRVMEAYQAR